MHLPYSSLQIHLPPYLFNAYTSFALFLLLRNTSIILVFCGFFASTLTFLIVGLERGQPIRTPIILPSTFDLPLDPSDTSTSPGRHLSHFATSSYNSLTSLSCERSDVFTKNHFKSHFTHHPSLRLLLCHPNFLKPSHFHFHFGSSTLQFSINLGKTPHRAQSRHTSKVLFYSSIGQSARYVHFITGGLRRPYISLPKADLLTSVRGPSRLSHYGFQQ